MNARDSDLSRGATVAKKSKAAAPPQRHTALQKDNNKYKYKHKYTKKYTNTKCKYKYTLKYTNTNT